MIIASSEIFKVNKNKNVDVFSMKFVKMKENYIKRSGQKQLVERR